MNNNLKSSAKMAIAMGILLPLAETIRRIHQIFDYREFFSWFDDYILGAILLLAAYSVFKKVKNSAAYLIAAWGIGTGALFLSLLAQFKYYQSASGDPGVFSTTFVAVAKALILLYMIIGLRKAIKANLQD